MTSGFKSITKVVSQRGPDNNPSFSPDGKSIVFSSAMGNPKFFYSNSRLGVVPSSGGTPKSITESFDEQPNFVEWNADGIYACADQASDPFSIGLSRDVGATFETLLRFDALCGATACPGGTSGWSS